MPKYFKKKLKKYKMLSKNEILAFLSEHKVALFAEYQLVKIGLFGSFARNEITEESDIDIIVEFQPLILNLKFFNQQFMSDKDKGNLLAIIDSCTKIRAFTQHILNVDAFFNDKKTFDAVLMNFVIIGESVARLTEETKDSNPQIPWIKIKGFRNLIAHNYFGIDAEEVWQIIKNNI